MNAWHVLVTCVVFNVALTAMFFKYSTHPTPAIAIGQLMIPMLVWEALLVLSCCPEELVDEWLLLNYIDDEAERFLIRGRRAHTVHSAGDAIQPQDFMLMTDESTLRTDGASFRFNELDGEQRMFVNHE